MGLDNSIMKIPIIDLLPSKFFTAIVWGNVGRDRIDVVVEFATNWIKYVIPSLISSASKCCKVMGYFQSSVEAKDKVKGRI